MAEGGMCSSTLRKFGEIHLRCSICLEIYRKPKTLTCLHSFCEECLVAYAKSAEKYVKCPLCKELTLIPTGGVINLPTDFRLESMKETVLQNQTQATPTCTTHAGKRCEVYCSTCSEIICVACITESHNRHDLKEIADTVATAKRDFMRDFLPMYETSLAQIADTFETVSGMKSDFLKTAEELRREVAANRHIMAELKEIQTMRESRYSELMTYLLFLKEHLEDAIRYSTGQMAMSDYDYLRRLPQLSGSFHLFAGRRIVPRIMPKHSALPVTFEPYAEPCEDVSFGRLSTGLERVKYVSITDCYNDVDSDGDDGGDDYGGMDDGDGDDWDGDDDDGDYGGGGDFGDGGDYSSVTGNYGSGGDYGGGGDYTRVTTNYGSGGGRSDYGGGGDYGSIGDSHNYGDTDTIIRTRRNDGRTRRNDGRTNSSGQQKAKRLLQVMLIIGVIAVIFIVLKSLL